MTKFETVKQLPLPKPGPSWEMQQHILEELRAIRGHLDSSGLATNRAASTNLMEQEVVISGAAAQISNILESLPEELRKVAREAQATDRNNTEKWAKVAEQLSQAARAAQLAADQLRDVPAAIREAAEANRPPTLFRTALIAAFSSVLTAGVVLTGTVFKLPKPQILLDHRAIAMEIAKNLQLKR